MTSCWIDHYLLVVVGIIGIKDLNLTLIVSIFLSTSVVYGDLVIQTDFDETSCAVWKASEEDLINQGSKDLISVSGDASGRRIAVTDGLIGGELSGDTSESETMSYDSSEYQVNYALGNSEHSAGYDITEIVTYAGWSSWRVNQIYEVLIKTTADDRFQVLAEVEFTPVINASPKFSNGSTRVRIHDDKGEPIARSVVEIGFRLKGDTNNIQSGSDMLGAMYREFDVFGKPSQ